MEGVGSRLGRASSRYGPTPTPVFSGPVRKWKKQWVQVSSSLSSTISHHHTTTTTNTRTHSSNGNANNNASALLLCRWTPIPSNHSADSDVKPEEPPRRKFRYTPIVSLEEKKKEAAKKVDDEDKTSKTNQSKASVTSKSDDNFEKPSIDNVFTEGPQVANKDELAPQHSNESHLDLDLDLDLCLKGHDENHDSDSENEEAKLGRVGSGSFWHLD